jgi:hypothetical protein
MDQENWTVSFILVTNQENHTVLNFLSFLAELSMGRILDIYQALPLYTLTVTVASVSPGSLSLELPSASFIGAQNFGSSKVTSMFPLKAANPTDPTSLG